ncbi:MAG: hypothetical protein M0P95_02300 [Sulfuritalea sp.]|jgi:hypothetical protein|nr:hypothetical protein [Sulfuritalea sp.]
MNKPGILTYAANFAPRLFQVRRTIWIAVGVGLLMLIGMLIWAALAMIGWLFGMGQNAPEAARRALREIEDVVPGVRGRLTEIMPPMVRGVLEGVDEIIPGARGKVSEIVSALQSPPQSRREVFGSDLGPVPRYSELAHTQWQREGSRTAVEYESEASYAAVLDHYSTGFATHGFSQTVRSAARGSETHEYTKGRDRFMVKIAEKPQGGVSVRLEAMKL